uniref:7TM_GPCR_Srx domain-containing protein n=1 Tax=Parastrongyloides trichosuri TaxID=131310 RepID=A0A0N5A0Q2_PARTI
MFALSFYLAHIYLTHKLKKGTPNISEKYQIQENLKVFKWFFPLVATFTIINIFYNIFQHLGGFYIFFKDDIINFQNTLLFISYIVFGIQFYIFRERKKKQAVQICKGNVCVRIPKKNTDETVTNRLNNINTGAAVDVKMITKENKTIPLNYDQQSYFNFFKQSWS